VVGTSITTGETTDKNGDGIITPPSAGSGNDASIVIGGVAGSVSFGQATVLGIDDTNANYTLEMSVVVADVNGNPVSDTDVNLSLWPIAWSTGSACSYDPDYYHIDDDANTLTPSSDDDGVPGEDVRNYYGDRGTFWNEDFNENTILDAGEDGRRCYASDSTKTFCIPLGGTPDGYITPVNSAAGTVPGTVTTDANGVAGFTLTYSKTSSIWTVVRIRASTIVQGTETVGEVSFRLAPLASDVTPTCKITGSPYNF